MIFLPRASASPIKIKNTVNIFIQMLGKGSKEEAETNTKWQPTLIVNWQIPNRFAT